MSEVADQSALFVSASPFQDDVLTLPVLDLDVAAQWYAAAFGMSEVGRNEGPEPQLVVERDGVRIGFAVNGRDSTQDGAAR